MTVLTAVAAATLLTYTPAASWLSAYNQSLVVNDYDQDVEHVDPAAAEQLAQADAYNDALSSGALLAPRANVPAGAGETSDASLEYARQLVTANGVMARLQIPAIDVDLPIYHGTSDATLLRGAGHLEGTSLPVGGADTHAVITAHRGLADATMFTQLDRLVEGDTFTISVFGEVLTYRVITTRVVAPEDTATLHQVAGDDLVTLVTCTPLGINTHRILVTGERVTPTPANAREASSEDAGVDPPWWLAFYLAALAAIGVYAWRGLRSQRGAR